MQPLVMVFMVCQALAGSPYRDHCRELRIPVVVSAIPTACVAKAQEYIAGHPEHFEDADVIAFGCAPRTRQATAGDNP